MTAKFGIHADPVSAAAASDWADILPDIPLEDIPRYLPHYDSSASFVDQTPSLELTIPPLLSEAAVPDDVFPLNTFPLDELGQPPQLGEGGSQATAAVTMSHYEDVPYPHHYNLSSFCAGPTFAPELTPLVPSWTEVAAGAYNDGLSLGGHCQPSSLGKDENHAAPLGIMGESESLPWDQPSQPPYSPYYDPSLFHTGQAIIPELTIPPPPYATAALSDHLDDVPSSPGEVGAAYATVPGVMDDYQGMPGHAAWAGTSLPLTYHPSCISPSLLLTDDMSTATTSRYTTDDMSTATTTTTTAPSSCVSPSTAGKSLYSPPLAPSLPVDIAPAVPRGQMSMSMTQPCPPAEAGLKAGSVGRRGRGRGRGRVKVSPQCQLKYVKSS